MKTTLILLSVSIIVVNVMYNAEKYHRIEPIVYAATVIPEVIQIEARVDWTTERIKKEVKDQAEKYKVDESQMLRVIDCESQGSTTIQSRAIYSRSHPEWGVKKGESELSFGLSQIHLPDHKDITIDQARNPKFAIEFMAKMFSQHQQRMWSCYRQIYDK